MKVPRNLRVTSKLLHGSNTERDTIKHTAAVIQGNNHCFAILDAVESIYNKQSEF